MTKQNAWTLALVSAGLVSLPAVVWAEEQPSSIMTALASTTISGCVDTSAQWNIGTGNANAPPYAFGGSGKADGFNLNVVDLALEKPVDTGEAWGAGYKVELWFGPDADTLATQSTGVAVDLAVKQAYVALHTPVGNGLDFQIGVFDTIVGYEVANAVNNPNFTRSYGYTIEPVAHTGIRAAYQFSETLAAIAGIANTFGPQINQSANPPKAESYKTYMGSIVLTAPEDMGFLAGSTLSGGVVNGYNSGASGGSGADQTSWFLGATLNTPVKGLKVGVAYDYAGVSSQPLSDSNYANAVAIYASYRATERLSLHVRGEYATSDALTPAATPILGSSKVVALTGTIQYDLWKNVMSRIEFRWDHSADGLNAYGGTPVVGSTDPVPPTLKNSYILLANISYRF